VSVFLREEQRELRALARGFAEGEIRPYAPAWDEARELDPVIFSKLGELGFLGMRIPEDWGGLALDLTSYLLILEELSWGDPSVALSVAIHCGPVPFLIERHGTEGQKERYLPSLATGDSIGSFALSEAGAGSDARALGTLCRRKGDGWVLEGRKKWVTNGGRGGVSLVFARDPDVEEGDGICLFLVEQDTEGYRVEKRETTMGFAASSTVEVELDEVEVGPGALVGEVGKGFTYAMESLEVGRLGVAALSLGIARAAMEHAREYAEERVQFGRPLAGFQAIRFKLAEMALRITGARSVMHAAAGALEATLGEGEEAGVVDPEMPSAGALAAMAKAMASEAAYWVADEAVQIFGGYGYMRDYPVEKLLRDAKGTEIFEGTNEIMRLVVARDALGESGA
jgi:hypothetical protein